MSVNGSNLHDIFEVHPGDSKDPYLSYLLEMESDGLIEIEELSYAPTKQFSWFVQGGERESPHETNEHLRLKRYLAAYLSETGSESVSVEVQTWFGYPDVGCLETKRFAECGRVSPHKFLRAFGRESNIDLLGTRHTGYEIANELIYAPYQPNKQTPPVKMYSFRSKE